VTNQLQLINIIITIIIWWL